MWSFEWDVRKAERNFRDHGVRFELAERVFDDSQVLFRRDYFESELRDQAIGVVGGTVLVVVHTVIHEDENSTRIRIISARNAERRERKLYREAFSWSE